MGYVSSTLTGRDSNQEIRDSDFSWFPTFHGIFLVLGITFKHTVWYCHEVSYKNVCHATPTSAMPYTRSSCHITFKTR